MTIDSNSEKPSGANGNILLDQIRESDPENHIISNAIKMLSTPEDIRSFVQSYSLQISDEDIMGFADKYGTLLTREKLALLDIGIKLQGTNDRVTQEMWKTILPDLYIPER